MEICIERQGSVSGQGMNGAPQTGDKSATDLPDTRSYLGTGACPHWQPDLSMGKVFTTCIYKFYIRK